MERGGRKVFGGREVDHIRSLCVASRADGTAQRMEIERVGVRDVGQNSLGAGTPSNRADQPNGNRRDSDSSV